MATTIGFVLSAVIIVGIIFRSRAFSRGTDIGGNGIWRASRHRAALAGVPLCKRCS